MNAAKEEVNQAQALDPQLAETHVARHFISGLASEGWQLEAAIRECCWPNSSIKYRHAEWEFLICISDWRLYPSANGTRF